MRLPRQRSCLAMTRLRPKGFVGQAGKKISEIREILLCEVSLRSTSPWLNKNGYLPEFTPHCDAGQV
ncbi:MAG: hypothetical protein KAS69_06605 [Planctomycetes bacterium]|nr:hypothetical protein [Planctomycetota bacterium]